MQQSGDEFHPPPYGLSPAGDRFWNFLFDRHTAEGNGEHSLLRSDLMALYRRDLEARKPMGDYLMEHDHGFIQWLFPLPARGVNFFAPVLAKRDYALIAREPAAREKLHEHFELFVQFLGLQPTETGFQKEVYQRWNGWISRPHNYLRISRVLESTSNFYLKNLSRPLYEFLNDEREKFGEGDFMPFTPKTNESCERYWSKAVSGTGWGRRVY